VTGRARRGFALLVAIGVLAVVGLILLALSDSLFAARQVSRRWRAASDDRLALTWAIRELRESVSAGQASAEVTGEWGSTPIRAVAVPLGADSPVYRHPAVSPRPGDLLATVELGGTTEHLLLRRGPPATHHHLPASLFAGEEAAP
jgi:hypothetical protein